MDFGAAIQRPFSDLKKFGIGTILVSIPVVNLIGSFFVSGFAVQAAKMTLSKKKGLPEWNNWIPMFVNGFKSVLITLSYMIPFLIALFVTIDPLIFAGWAAFANEIDSIWLLLFVVLPLFLLALYILPMALMNFVSKGLFGAAFDFGVILPKVLRLKYLGHWILLNLYFLVICVGYFLVSMVLLFIPFIGQVLQLLLAGAMAYMIQITSFTLFAELYSEK